MTGRNLCRLRGFALVVAMGLSCVVAPAAWAQPSQVHIGVILPATADEADLRFPVAQAARQGAIMAEEEFQLNANMFGIDFEVVSTEADADGMVAAAEALLADGNVFAIAGGFDATESRILSEWTAAKGVPFINLFAADDRLRNQLCAGTSFHVAPSAAMYLDSLAGWYVRAGFRNWFVVQADSEEGADQYQRLGRSLNDRHFGAREVGHAVVAAGAAIGPDLVAEIAGSGADVVLLLTPAQDQLSALAAMEAAELDLMVTGFPYAEAQTRAFFELSRDAAPKLGSGMRATAWEPTLDAYGARELNARYMGRWNEPMEGAAWATYQGIKVLFEAAMFSGSTDTQSVLNYLSAPTSVFDVWKGIGTSFRPWDHQLRQPLYLSKIDEQATDAKLLGQLVGELPAIYMPGTDPVERLDQMGDLAPDSQCQF